MARLLSKELTEKQIAQGGLININVYLPPALYEQMKKLSVETDTPVSALTRKALRRTYKRAFEKMKAKEAEPA